MNLDRVGQGVQLAANVGVILSILFLAYQIAEQRELMKAQTRTDIASGITELLTSEATDANLANALRRNNDGEELSADDYFLLDRVTRAYFRYWEDVHYQYRNGLFERAPATRRRRQCARRPGAASRPADG